MKTVSITTYKQFLTEVKTEALAQGWTSLRDLETSGLRELILQSPNNAIVGFREFTNNSTYYNILLNYATSYDSTKTLFNQPGSIYHYPENTTDTDNEAPTLTLHNNVMNLFIFINVNRIVVVANALSKYVSCYVGRYLRNGTEGQLPNNLFAGGSSLNNSTNLLNSNNLSTFYLTSTTTAPKTSPVGKDELNQNLKMLGSTTLNIHPFNYYSSLYNIKSKTGNVVLYPSVLTYPDKDLGELDGIFFLSSIDQRAPENELTLDGETYKIFINANKTTNNADYFAVKI